MRTLAIRSLRYCALAFLVIWPWYKGTYVLLGDAAVALGFVIVGASLVLLTGWTGQISLAQASFVGIGAFLTALVANHAHLGFPLSAVVGGVAGAVAAGLLGLVALRVRGLYLAVATLIFAWMCDAYVFTAPWLTGGLQSVSVRSLPIGESGTFPYFDLTNRRTFYYVGLAVAAAVLFGLSNLRDSKSGRALFSVRGSEVAAASLGIDVTRYKLLAFALSGFVAGLAGNLLALNQGALTPSQFDFTQSLFFLAIPVVGGLQSLNGVAAAALVFGALNDAFYRFTVLNGYLDVVSALLLGAVLLLYPSGLAGIPSSLGGLVRALEGKLPLPRPKRVSQASGRGLALGARPRPARPVVVVRPRRSLRALLERSAAGRRLARHLRHPWPSRDQLAQSRLVTLSALGLEHAPGMEAFGAAPTEDAAPRVPPASSAPVHLPVGSEVTVAREPPRPEWLTYRPEKPAGPRYGREIVLEASGITVRFGGLTAVNDVSLAVRRGEIVGLIGPNGAGKTTLFNAVAGLNHPTAGTVAIWGQDTTRLPVHERAKLGVGRTFQAIQLLTDLTVFDNLMVATHLQNHTGFLSHIAVTRRSIVSEDACRALVERVIGMLGLDDVARRQAGDLPFGTLRMVEVARAIVTRSPLVMLDEPASGLDNAETERLSQLLFYLRGALGLSILLIEHDVHMVTKMCDYIYVIDRGNLIAEGITDEIRRNPAVVNAYLGAQPADEATIPDRAGEPA